LPTLQGKGNVLHFEFGTDKTVLQQKLEAEGVQKLRGEIRWSCMDRGKCLHGIMFLGLSERQGEQFGRLLFQEVFEKVSDNGT
jgi:hypothetical protein